MSNVARIRQALELAHAYAKVGILFVPVPCEDEAQFQKIGEFAIGKIGIFEEAIASQNDSAETKRL